MDLYSRYFCVKLLSEYFRVIHVLVSAVAFYCLIVFHCVTMQQFLHSFDENVTVSSFLAIVSKAAMNILIQAFHF